MLVLDGMPSNQDEIDLTASICRESYEDFVREFWSEVPGSGKMSWNWHMSVLCKELQDVAERVFKWQAAEYDLIINISPGTSKSTLCSILFQPWICRRWFCLRANWLPGRTSARQGMVCQ